MPVGHRAGSRRHRQVLARPEPGLDRTRRATPTSDAAAHAAHIPAPGRPRAGRCDRPGRARAQVLAAAISLADEDGIVTKDALRDATPGIRTADARDRALADLFRGEPAHGPDLIPVGRGRYRLADRHRNSSNTSATVDH